MPSEIRRLMFFHTELFDALTAYGKELGYNFPGVKIIAAKLASQAEYDFHTQKTFKTPLSQEYNINDMKNSVVVTFFDEKTFEHKYYNLPSRFISEALIEYCLAEKIPLPRDSKKKQVSNVVASNISIDLFPLLCRYSKLGYAGNKEPQFIIPSAIAVKETAKVGDDATRRLARGVEDLDFFIGDEAMEATGYAVKVTRSSHLWTRILFGECTNDGTRPYKSTHAQSLKRAGGRTGEKENKQFEIKRKTRNTTSWLDETV